MNFEYIIKKGDKFYNIKDVLINYFKVSSRLLSKLKNNNCIFLNKNISNINNIVNAGDLVSFCLNYDEDNSNIIPTKMHLDIIYEDDCLLIVNKPSNIAIHPSLKHYENSLSNGVKYYFDSINLKKKIRPVNRLDRNTSGLVIFAKNEYVQEFLINQMHNNTFIKEYIAILEGTLVKKQDILNFPIARKTGSIIERCVDKNGSPSLTEYCVLDEFNNFSLVKFKLLTGRTHQIRVHCSYIGNPILGDDLYGNISSLINRQALHSYKVGFIHPITRKYVEFSSELPVDIKSIIEKYKQKK